MCCVCVNSKEPGQTRVRRWGFGINEVLKDPVGREQFLKFLESEFSSENLRYTYTFPLCPLLAGEEYYKTARSTEQLLFHS